MNSKEKNTGTYISILSESGVRLTRSRKEIIELLIENPGKICVEDIYFKAHKKRIKIGLTTIYRTIKIFEKIGIVNAVEYKEGKIKYRLEESSIKKA